MQSIGEDKYLLEDGTIIEGVNEIPEENLIFNCDQMHYVSALTGQVLLNDVKGQMLNIIEGCGMSDKQEIAVKRMITNVLHETAHHIKESIELVTKY